MPEKHQATAEELAKARRKMAALLAEAADDPEEAGADSDGAGDDHMDGDEDAAEGAAAAAAGAAPPRRRGRGAAAAAAAAGGDADISDGDDDEESDGSGIDLGLAPQGADEGLQGVESDDESEVNDLEIRETDALFMCCHQRQKGEPALEVYVYDDPQDNIYLHHDIALPAIPLSCAWHAQGPPAAGAADAGPAKGSFAAVGTFLPFIEVWDLDVLDAPDPVLTLGGCKRREENYCCRNIKPKQLRKGSHRDAVLCLAWNPGVQKVLASGSADHSVKLWDLTTGECLETLSHHQLPVQALAWNPRQPQALLSGSFDGSAAVTDCRTKAELMRWKLKSTPEAVAWSPHAEQTAWVTLESGELAQLDARHTKKPVWRCGAHTGEAAGLAVNPAVPGLIATAGVDNQVRLWDVRTEPHGIASRDLGQGRVFSMSFCPERPTLLLAGGDAGKPLVYCVRDDVAGHFGGA